MKFALVRGKSPVSSIIRWWTRSVYSHVAMLMSDGSVYEAVPAGFVHVPSLATNHLGTVVDILAYRVPLSPAEIELAEIALQSMLGQLYDYKMLLGLPSFRHPRPASVRPKHTRTPPPLLLLILLLALAHFCFLLSQFLLFPKSKIRNEKAPPQAPLSSAPNRKQARRPENLIDNPLNTSLEFFFKFYFAFFEYAVTKESVRVFIRYLFLFAGSAWVLLFLTTKCAESE